MIQRFEMPVASPNYNTFLVDDYLRSLRSPEERVKLINTYGYSEEKREEYERQSGLPHGAVELALVCEDKQVAELNVLVREKITRLYEEKASPAQIKAALDDMNIASRAAGIQALYPDAFRFLMQYNAQCQRGAASFRGDYPFSNEYKITQVDCSPSSASSVSADGPCGWAAEATCVNTIIIVNVSVFGLLYAYVVAVAWVIAALFIWVAAFVIP